MLLKPFKVHSPDGESFYRDESNPATEYTANVAQGAEAVTLTAERVINESRNHFGIYPADDTNRLAFEARMQALAAPPAQTATTVTPAMVKAAIPWLTGLHHMRNTDAKAHIEEAIKAALTAAQSAGDTK